MSILVLLVPSDADGGGGDADGGGWVRAPHRARHLVINSGELLAQVSNDTWPATRHYAVFARGEAAAAAAGAAGEDCDEEPDRYSLPFFFNATPTYRMAVVPTCCSPENPPKYPPLSYLLVQKL